MLNHSEIQHILPHRYPLLLLDSVCTLVPGNSIVAIKCVTANESCYAYIAENAENDAWAYPLSLIVESFGQAGAVLWMQSVSLAESKLQGTLVFTVARDCFFERDVFPGDVMEHRVKFDRVVANSAIFNGEVWVKEQRIARIEWIMATVVKPDCSILRQIEETEKT
jgi:3-hydroxyacyl-[acyl-carrier-protein] dehydratase